MANHTYFSETSEHVTASIHDHGLVLFDAARGRLFSANRTGADVWRGLEQGLSIEHIAADLSGRYAIPLETARTHTTRFISQLAERRLVAGRLS